MLPTVFVSWCRGLALFLGVLCALETTKEASSGSDRPTLGELTRTATALWTLVGGPSSRFKQVPGLRVPLRRVGMFFAGVTAFTEGLGAQMI